MGARVKAANYGPFYAAGFYPRLAEVFRKHGYALAVHGSVGTDFDLIAVPWVDEAAEPEAVVADLVKPYAAFGVALTDVLPFSPRPHGRLACKIPLSFGDCSIDVSFTPRLPRPARLA